MAVPITSQSSGQSNASIHKPWVLIQAGVLMNVAALSHVEKSGTVTDIIFHSSAGDAGKTLTFADQAARDAAFTRIVTHLTGMAVYADLSS